MQEPNHGLPHACACRLDLALYAALILGSLIMLAPFFIMLVVSLWPNEAFLARRFPLNQITLNNFAEAFRVLPFGRYFLNSAIVTVTVTVLQILISSLAAFAFARLRFRGRETIFLLYLATLMIPVQVTLIPNFLIIKNLGWYNTYLALTVPALFSALSTFLLRQYYRGHPAGSGRGGAHGRRVQPAHLVADDRAAQLAGDGGAGDLHLPGHLE